MSLRLHVDTGRWRAHLGRALAASPDLVPVVKGNGYGFGNDRLLAECARLGGAAGVSTIAVGTYPEAGAAVDAFPGDVLVLEPFREVLHGALAQLGHPALVHTVAAPEDLPALCARARSPRVVLEGLTSMNRHGMPPPQLGALVAEPGAATVVGATLHLPLGGGHLDEVQGWVEAVAGMRSWFVSHVGAGELAALAGAHPDRRFRPRVGTALWLGDQGALAVRADVLDVRHLGRGQPAGYRQRRTGGTHLVVVSGGTAHGVAVEAPGAVSGLRQRAVVVAEGLLEAAGRVRSPFTVAGRPTWFLEPPHMQVSMVVLPERATPPRIGQEALVRVRHTLLRADAVVMS